MIDEQKIEKNEVIIAERDYRFYLGVCDTLFQRFDQIILVARAKYMDKLMYIANLKKALGVIIDKEYQNKSGKPLLKTETIEAINEHTGRREQIVIHKLGLTKIPDLFMYTDPDSILDIPIGVEEEKED